MGTLRMIEIKCRIVITIVAILDDLHPPTLCKIYERFYCSFKRELR